MLSAGSDIKDVNTEASVADKLSLNILEMLKYFYISSEIIYFDASCPMFIRITLNIVILIPVHSAKTPSSDMILLKASYVLL
jgi:hypothetical protein